MPRIDLTTQTARYFLARYGKASIQAAVEAAARKERKDRRTGVSGSIVVPVDVNLIAAEKKIAIEKASNERNISNATLFANDTGYHLRLGAGGSILRRRFTIAHEIGHTLFFRGPQHQIGTLSRRELAAEEAICDLFAAALLMPGQLVKHALTGIRATTPWSIFQRLQSSGQRMQVSLPAFLLRMGHIQVEPPFPMILLCLRFFPNARTGQTPCLRVDICSSLGSLHNTHTWHNKSVASLNLKSALDLFETWRLGIGSAGEPHGGIYARFDGELVRAQEETTHWVSERIALDVERKGKWQKEQVEMEASSCLYAAKGWGEDMAYVVTALRPSALRLSRNRPERPSTRSLEMT